MEILGWEVLNEWVLLVERQAKNEIASVNKREFVLGKGGYSYAWYYLHGWLNTYIALLDSIITVISKSCLLLFYYMSVRTKSAQNIRPLVVDLSKLSLLVIRSTLKAFVLGKLEYYRMQCNGIPL